MASASATRRSTWPTRTQINNPDRILPGQIFGVPKEALPNAEELHRKRLSGEHF
ncbi:hypothetical protein [Rhizobium yanglingense]